MNGPELGLGVTWLTDSGTLMLLNAKSHHNLSITHRTLWQNGQIIGNFFTPLT
jgi:hypothetical protein